jgi:fluoride exporter
VVTCPQAVAASLDASLISMSLVEKARGSTNTSSMEEKAIRDSGSPAPARSPLPAEMQREASVDDARSLVSADRPPSAEEKLPPSKIYHPFSLHVIALLIPASIFGALARVGLLGLTTYDGRAIFPLAWVQAAGCFIMGFALGMKEPIGQL